MNLNYQTKIDMEKRILEILDNVRYWETCPDDYKKDIETFLDEQKQALRKNYVVEQSEQFFCCVVVNGQSKCEKQCQFCKDWVDDVKEQKKQLTTTIKIKLK